MRYEVKRDFYVAEFDIPLAVGEVFADGDTDPDLVANLLSQGVIVVEGAPEPKPVKKTVKPETSEGE